jgi:hypothetical protein
MPGMRPQILYSTIIFSSFMCTTASVQAADTFIPYGWTRAWCDGREYKKSLGEMYPSHWALAQIENNGYNVTATRSSSMMSNESGNKFFDAVGTISVAYKIKTNRQQPAGYRPWVTVNNVANSSGSCDIYGIYASSTVTAEVELSTKVGFYLRPYSYETSDGPKSRTKLLPVGTTWTTEADGTYSQVVSLKSLELWVTAMVRNGLAVPTSPVMKANLVGTAGAHSSVKMYPTAMTFKSDATGFAGVAPTYYENVSVDVFSEYNVPLGSWDIELDENGEAWLPFNQFPDGVYHLYVSSRSALRKKITVQYNSVIGVSGLDYTLKFGDLNRDNVVSSAEVSFVQSMIGTNVWNVPSYYPDINGPYYARQCDFNRDGVVNSVDYGLALQNVGQVGQ